jgi:hypothetical protein
MLVQKTVTTNTNFAGRLSEGMLRKTADDSKRQKAKNKVIFAIQEIKRINPNWAGRRYKIPGKTKSTTG